MLRKFIFVWVATLLLLSMPLSLAAEATSDRFVDDPIGLLSREEYEILMNRECYNYTMENVDLSDAKFIRLYRDSPLRHYDECNTFEDVLSTAEAFDQERQFFSYFVYDNDDKYMVYRNTRENAGPNGLIFKHAIPQNEGEPCPPTYVVDIENLGKNIEICGVDCTVQRIVCTDGSSYTDGSAIFLDTDKGTFVKYYDHYLAESMDLSFEDFKQYVLSYREYIDSLLDENSGYQYVFGGNSFTEFVKGNHTISGGRARGGSDWYTWATMPILIILLMVIPVIVKKRKR